MSTLLKRTALYSEHQALGGRLIEFGGWVMPVQYTGIVEEHLAVRQAAGLFDISHMGEVWVEGPDALGFLNRLLTNDAAQLVVGQGQYSLLCNEQGGTIDDLYLFRVADERYLLIINASRIEADLVWMRSQLESHPGKNLQLRDGSGALSAIALQGPMAPQIVDSLCLEASHGGAVVGRPSGLVKNQMGCFEFKGAEVWISRTGYTGEDGFELVIENSSVVALWRELLESGRAWGCKPAGLGARDTLRTEVCYPLYGHELTEQRSPIEAGLGFFVALNKSDFIGREILARQKIEGVDQKCIAFRMTEKAPPPRPDYLIWCGDDLAQASGRVVSGTQSPSLNQGIGMGYVPKQTAKPGTPIHLEIRGRKFAAQVVAKPIYRKASTL